MKLSEFDYNLPRELIAKHPLEKRDHCRLMVLDRKCHGIKECEFRAITSYFNKGDLLIINNTRVIPARLHGSRRTGGRVEIFLLEKKGPICEALIKPSGRIAVGEKIILQSGYEVQVLGTGEVGRFVQFDRSVEEILTRAGCMPLPPYIDREAEESDKFNYQTVYASKEGATASPTAGLHFTKELLRKITEIGVWIAPLTLHTNYGTFAPIKTEDVEAHRMHKERFELPHGTIEAIRRAKAAGNKITAVGTTTARVLEHCSDIISGDDGKAEDVKGHTDMYIYPGYKFKVVDRLITNFHLPRSTLLLLVSAFAGKDYIMEAYKKAIEDKYRFFSYGDAMLII